MRDIEVNYFNLIYSVGPSKPVLKDDSGNIHLKHIRLAASSTDNIVRPSVILVSSLSESHLRALVLYGLYEIDAYIQQSMHMTTFQ